ncbi:hypothetical protein [Pelagibius sp. Alg239-R121]|uniref:hypothetical protein n=1 Tax=Pelagibius sp. Alg239-R121 TaxID=2993448 RepID=UPI0024A6D50F|nr:hypothetical protein [Pelagibius sp. Alg239-R121]
MLLYDPDNAIYQIDGMRMDLAREYRDNLRGPFSLELQRVLDKMRSTPMKGRYALIVDEPFRRFSLARLSGERGVPPERIDGVTYTSLAEAEWDLFKRRWQDLTSHSVTVEDP